ncbi:hypothetical protein BLNAU_4854 [Blattamonas nauphoetae]|uniref:Uncharacterized protein n=1 Tax=Blattamonas nauphoetae TaxID=2049346 RepID=A0ABQ9Y976_9EUKA|nr:hypothetical protein BLNAU_4854 [Blattamonas nauphoetae]
MTAESHHHLFSIILSSMLGKPLHIGIYIQTHSFDSILQILYEQVLQPAGPYLSWCCENRNALAMASPKSFKVAGLLLMLLQLGMHHEPTLTFAFSLHACLIFTTSLLSFEDDSLINFSLEGLTDCAYDCKYLSPSQRPQWKDILQRLDDEGLADELDVICFWETSPSSYGPAIRQKHSRHMNDLAANVPRL